MGNNKKLLLLKVLFEPFHDLKRATLNLKILDLPSSDPFSGQIAAVFYRFCEAFVLFSFLFLDGFAEFCFSALLLFDSVIKSRDFLAGSLRIFPEIVLLFVV